MKTPMQELMDSLKQERMNPSNEWQLGYQKALSNVISEIESMLEKEKETICNAFSDARHGAVESRWTAEEYFEEIFDTKEKWDM